MAVRLQLLCKLRILAIAGCIPFACIIMQSCRLFKNVKTTSASDEQYWKVQERASLSAAQSVETDQHMVEWRLDSSQNSVVVQIWPKGRFRFSTESGFEGEAEKLVLNGNFRKTAAGFMAKDSTVKVQNQLKAEISGKKEKKMENKHTVKTEKPAFWVMIGLVVVIGLGLLVWRLK